jgi:hypothetical protein
MEIARLLGTPRHGKVTPGNALSARCLHPRGDAAGPPDAIRPRNAWGPPMRLADRSGSLRRPGAPAAATEERDQ